LTERPPLAECLAMTMPPATRLSHPLVLACLLAIVAHRAVVGLWLCIAPDPAFLTGHWQHLDLADLHADLTGTLLNLQSQPPLWNATLGLASVACGAQMACVVSAVHFLHMLLTMGLFLLLAHIALRLTGHAAGSALIALGFCLSPAAIYYENYLFYPHLTAFLFTLFAWALLEWLTQRRLWALALLGGALVLLSWTWTLFHPLFVALVLGSVLLAARPRGWAGAAGYGVALVVLALSLAPSVKNQAMFGFFGAGSWMGLNLAQVAPGGVEGCGFGDFIESHGLTGVHLGTALNDPRIIAFSDECRGRAVERIIAQPLTYGTDRLRQILSALSMRPSDYIFDPLNWENYPGILRDTEVRDAQGNLRPVAVATRLSTLAFNLALLGFLLMRLTRSRDALERRFLAVMVVFFVLFFGLAHAANGSEQERMRYTLHPLLWLYGWLMLWAVVRLVTGRREGRRDTAPSRPLPGGGR
jgi:hypothetical protein